MQRKRFDSPPRRVALFVTCMVDMMYPRVGMATVDLLERHGVEVVFPEEQTCCGQPAFNAGYRDDARVLARRFLDVFGPLVERGDVQAIVAPSGSCTTMTSHFYPDALFEARVGESEQEAINRRRAKELAAVTFELTEFLVDVLGVTEIEAPFSGRVTYHACCHTLRELHVDEQPRTLLQNLPQADVVPLADSEGCCGFGGLFAIKNAPISTAMGERKALNVAKSEADVVAMCDVSCMTHVNGLLSRQKQHARAVHIAEVLAGDVDVETTTVTTETVVEKPRRWQDASGRK